MRPAIIRVPHGDSLFTTLGTQGSPVVKEL